MTPPHNDFVRPLGVWSPSTVPTAADIATLDTNAASALNGDAGGTWNPATPIIIGGAPPANGTLPGTALQVINFRGTGGVTTKNGGRLCLGLLSTIGALSKPWPYCPTQKSRTLLMDLFRASGNFISTGNGLLPVLNPMGVFPSTPFGPGFNVVIPKRYLHQGAQLVQVTLQMMVNNLGQGAPQGSATLIAPRFDFTISTHDGAQIANSRYGLPQWKPSTAYSSTAPNYVRPRNQHTDGFGYQCTTSGTSSSSTEPTWPGLGNTVSDNGVVWTGVDFSGCPMPGPGLGTVIGAYNGHGLSELQAIMSFNWACASNAAGLIVDTTQYSYGIQVSQDTLPLPCVVFTSIQLSYADIGTLQTE